MGKKYYSHSKLETYRQCKLKYYYKYVKEIPAAQNSIALMKGKLIHFKIEQDFKNNASIEESHTYNDPRMSDILVYECNDVFNRFKGTPNYNKIKSLPSIGNEVRIGLGWDFKPVNYDDPNVMFHGIIDYLGLKDDTAIIIDWKTGKTKKKEYFPIAHQLALYSLWAIQVMRVNKVITTYVYLEQDETITYSYTKENLGEVVGELKKIINDIENEKVWKPSKTKLCDFCEYKNICGSEE